jgi:hypothetical protein
VWAQKKDAMVVVYPHYFTGAEVPGLGVRAARQPFDPRWAVFYTPHSAHPDPDLTRKAAAALWSDDAPARGTPAEVRAGARRARADGCSGYVPSFEAFSYVPTEPEEGAKYLVGRRRVPFGFGWLREGRAPYAELPARVNRVAFREYARDPDLSDAAFRRALGQELFGAAATPAAVDDALAVQRVLALDRTWSQAAPAADPERVRAMAAAGRLSAGKRAEYRAAVDRMRRIAERYRDAEGPLAELHRAAAWVAGQWAGEAGNLLRP